MKSPTRLFHVLIVAVFLLAVGLPFIQAQEPIEINQNKLGEISANNPQPFFLVTVAAGQEVVVDVLALAANLAPEIRIFNQNGVELQAISSTNPARVSGTVVFPEAGTYSIQVSSKNQAQGQFVLSLLGEVIETGPPPLDAPASGQLAGSTSQSYALTATETTLLNLGGVGVTVEILDENGQVVAVLTSFSDTILLGVPAGSYTVVVKNETPDPINYTISTSPLEVEEEQAPVATEEAAPDQTEEAIPAETEEAAPDGPTATQPTGQQNPQVTATFTSTATQTTEQENLQVTATFTPTATQTTGQENLQVTATFTPSYTPTATQTVAQATATYTPSYTPTTPPPPPVAPEDANFNSPLTIPLDSTASVTDFVSYPGGDREDRVRFDVSGMNPNSALSGGRARLIIAVSCFGTGTQNIQFFTGGQTYSCGQTIVDREITYDSRTGQVTITAVGGEGTYVQWVLTGTVTRVN